MTTRFNELLLDRQLLSARELLRVQEVCTRTGGRLPSTLARLGLVGENDILDTLAAATGLPVVRREDFPPDGVRIEGLNPRFLRRHSVLPLRNAEGVLALAMSDPYDEEARSALAFAAAMDVEPLIASFADISAAISEAFPANEEEPGEDIVSRRDGDEDLERLTEGESEAPVIRLVQRLLADAVDRRASDVHIEPMARHLAVRYRIDGRLVEVERHSEALGAPVASRIKVMAGLDIAEARLPQDGRLRLTVRGRDVDVRVSTSPIAHGESIVLRLLGRSEVPLDLDRLGLPPAALAKLHRALDRPHGIILLTGPTGSGKTTTLYAAINRLRRPEVKILTVEDPVEVLLEGVNQVQVRPDIDLSYAATLRAFLRQDPDILMIGEIRDGETAEIAMRAALTGHLVLSTLHTNSAIGAFARLADIGIEPFLTASTMIATIAQRLIRALCDQCAAERSPSSAEQLVFEEAGLDRPHLLRSATGCSRCAGTGYSGRIPLIEILEVDERLRDSIRHGTEFDDRRAVAETLLGHGLRSSSPGEPPSRKCKGRCNSDDALQMLGCIGRGTHGLAHRGGCLGTSRSRRAVRRWSDAP